ncbi:MAG TPA: AMMECR1 domain-containing protein [Vulgatibacter sp.]|nr:AMMECR1 domain-containing protein [Vulgatibacter sp.]
MSGAIDTLLARARAALRDLPAAPEEPAGLFVALRDEAGEVRGSVGTTEPGAPIAELLPAIVREAAMDDPRHPPVGDEEAGALSLELWILRGPPRTVRSPSDLEPARDALRVRKGVHAGILLPDVATAGGWSAATTLAYACRKAGLPAHAWREPDTVVEAFVASRVTAP